MNKWIIPLAVFGVGSLGVLILSDAGLEKIQWLVGKIQQAPQSFMEWNDSAQRELDRIQSVLNHVSETLQIVH